MNLGIEVATREFSVWQLVKQKVLVQNEKRDK